MTCRDKVGTQSHFSTTVWFSRLKLHFGLACQQSLLHERPLEQHVAITCSDQFVSLQAAGDRDVHLSSTRQATDLLLQSSRYG